MMINTISQYNNYNQTQNKPSFKGSENTQQSTSAINRAMVGLNNKYEKAFEPVIDRIAKGTAKLGNSNAMKKYAEFVLRHPSIEKNLYSHLIVLGSTVLSGFYVAKTINNKDMDKDKRRTLAINQGITFIVSTIMAYTFDKWSQPAYKDFIQKYETINAANKDIAKLSKGLKIAKSTITVDMVYRFIAPVAVTPIANIIGNYIANKHKMNKLAKSNNFNPSQETQQNDNAKAIDKTA